MGDPAADGYDTVVIESPDSDLRATFVPRAGMVCCSLSHRGVELLAQRSGVRAYVKRGATMGIPLLYPWANRLAGLRYPGPQGEVQLDPADPLLKLDQNGLPIHGVIAGALPWELLEQPGAGADRVHARLSWRSAELLAIFPFAHSVEMEARLEGESTLAVETSVHADVSTKTPAAAAEVSAAPMPVSFGYHPYLTIPGNDRSQWTVELPVSRRLRLDERMIPTGESEPFERRRFQLANGSWDDAFAGLLDPPIFSVISTSEPGGSDDAGAGIRRISLELRRGYTHAQLYAPAGEDFVCFEPMTAPTNALVSHDGLPLLAPGEAFQATFAVTVHASVSGRRI